MKAGGARHAVLEEIITKVDVVIRLAEEQWGWKKTNFIHGPYQLFLDATVSFINSSIFFLHLCNEFYFPSVIITSRVILDRLAVVRYRAWPLTCQLSC
ncbi:hypothetical protein HanIR_Chr14g0699141 [Helianthus annuus]|nr:hypothetical protein HanIR_Chr14g0699141 [Helianthus annuus]